VRCLRTSGILYPHKPHQHKAAAAPLLNPDSQLRILTQHTIVAAKFLPRVLYNSIGKQLSSAQLCILYFFWWIMGSLTRMRYYFGSISQGTERAQFGHLVMSLATYRPKSGHCILFFFGAIEFTTIPPFVCVLNLSLT
jgi:hypothetical protein